MSGCRIRILQYLPTQTNQEGGYEYCLVEVSMYSLYCLEMELTGFPGLIMVSDEMKHCHFVAVCFESAPFCGGTRNAQYV